MPLSDADKALLQLFLEGGLDYAGAASVLSRTPQEVSEGARAALGRISSSSEGLPASVADWLIGQGDAISNADALNILSSDEATRRSAVVTASALKLIFPNARIPEMPTPPEPGIPTSPLPPRSQTRADQPPPPPSPTPSPPLESSPAEPVTPPSPGTGAPPVSPPVSTRLADRIEAISGAARRRPSLVAVCSAALLLGAIALAVIFLGGGGSDGDSGSSGKGKATLVPLGPTASGGSGQGRALILSSGKAAIVQANLSGLPPTSKDENYVLWLYRSPTQAYPLARDRVGKTGRLTGPAPIPQDLKPPLEDWGCIELTLASRAEIAASLRRVASAGSGPAVGKSILRGEIAPSERDPRSGSASVCLPSARG